jgi:hypothetical protein
VQAGGISFSILLSGFKKCEYAGGIAIPPVNSGCIQRCVRAFLNAGTVQVLATKITPENVFNVE